MANFTETTNYSFKKPTVGADTDQWGTHLNETIDGVDSQLKTLADSITSQQLEQLGNVVNVTPVDDQFLRYNGTNWTAETVTIPDVLNDLSNVSGTPSSGDVLTYNGSAWAPASVTSAAVTDGSVTNAKLHPSLQTVIGRILVTDDDDSPTDNQILVYSTTDSEWKYADQAGSTLQTLTDVNTTGLSDGDLMQYDGTAGEFVFIDATAARTLLSVDVSGTDNSTPVTLNTSSHDYLTLSSQQITLGPIVLTDDVSGILPIANGGTSASTASGARTALGLGGLATQSTITESQISDLQSYITASSTDTLTNKSGNISMFTNDSGYLTAETNDLTNVSGTLGTGNGGTGLSAIGTANQVLAVNSSATGLEFQTISITESQISDLQSYLTAEVNDLSSSVTWTNVPDANITQSSVTQHQAALSITESQISDLQSYLTAESNDLSSVVTWVNVPDINITESSVTQHQAALSITESQISDLGSYQTSDAGLTSIAGLTTAADKMIYTTASDTYSVTTLTTAGRALLDDADAEAQRTTLGLGTAATTASTAYATAVQGATADTALQDVVDDTTPQLGGDLDVNGNSIVSASNGNIAITPNGTGNVSLGNFTFDADQTVGVGQDNYVLTYDHSTTSISLEAATGGISDIVSDTTPQLGGSLDVNGQSIVSVSAGNIAITPDTTGKIILDGLSWPTADGSADQVLKTDGAGNLSFVNQSGGGGSGSSYIEHSSTVSDSLAISAGTNRMYVGNASFSSGGVTMAGYLVISHGYANFTGASALNITGTLNVVS